MIFRQQKRYGYDIPLSQEKQAILDKADKYMKNHQGFKLMRMAQT